VLPGIYAAAGAPKSWHQQLKAATLALDGVASHKAAANLWQLPGFSRGVIEVATTHDRRPRASNLVVRCVPSLEKCDVTEINSIPVTTAARTLFDLAGTADPEILEQALDHCLHQRLASLPRLRWTLERLGARGRSGTSVMRELLDARPNGYVPTQSPLETRAARRILRALELEGLPAPARQYVIRDDGRFVAQVDFAYPHAKLAIEAQSVKHHAGRLAWERDSKRMAQLAAIGWRTLPVTWDDTESNLRAAIERVRRAIQNPTLFD
jgi:very-short-patch-repair endonuclease